MKERSNNNRSGDSGRLCSNLPCDVWIYREKIEKAENFISNFTNPVGAIKNDGEYIQARILSKNDLQKIQ